ncbi:hypothetical protein ASPWEDRAFT_47218 [Aspergillus wentii DTO 134E9]|uniref:Uncharacterized protein n=1 Tax=Aspergillus wentii DTO 134E9 TaxID=1073089 RepID=A0A1L9RZP1_ASPWE|nr:uncharacterized protein ASPWEDRAFT_47218 [Aspergillus wentii DTO 134E9]OJJ40373.1 hypothetical protein ASPWEDRAFT_47218 [Aspergillus wentii DTO 134E9]
MVVFVDFDNDAFDEHRLPQGPDSLFHSYTEPGKPSLSRLTVVGSDLPSHPMETSSDDHPSADLTCDSTPHTPPEQEQTPNRNAFSAALSCYPIVTEIARRVDLNTLHALSRTCRQFHANLTPCRQQLVKQTLRCENEYIETLSDMLSSGAAIPDSVKSVIRLLSKGAVESGRLTSGKVGKCARDMVAECRRCSRVVCRNCTIKPPTTAMFKNRVRRLCTTCCTAPLERHLTSSAVPSASSFTTSAFMRTPCSCDDAVWLCHPCGQMIRNSDTTYRRVWTWRTRYSTYLGGLGTGIGEGCQGVKCGRGEDCLAAQEIELEVECGSDGVSTNFHDLHGSHNHGDEQPGYFRQEIVGIGGVVKQKAKKRITVGACVVEHEDERETGKYLTREEERQQRSWCGWCWRVIPAKSDIHEI